MAVTSGPRLRVALHVAGDPTRVAQVLAGSTSLLARRHPDDLSTPLSYRMVMN